MITLASVSKSCEAILGSIPAVRISTGILSITVLVGDEPMIILTPVGGQLMVATRRSLRARPRASSTVVHHTSSRDEDWESFTTSHLSAVAAALHAAQPGIEYRSGLARRIAARLGGARGKPLAPTDARYWTALARWIEGSGQLGRRDAKFARIYARKLDTGGPVSAAFRTWAMKTAEAADAAGFAATAADLADSPARALAATKGEATIEPELDDFAADEPTEDEPLPAAVLELVLTIDGLRAADVAHLAVSAPGDDAARVRARAAAYRTADPGVRRAATAAISHALSDLEARADPPANLRDFTAAALDAGAALVLDGQLDPDMRDALLAPWQAVIERRGNGH